MTVQFTVYAKPEPQGSIRAFMIGGRPRLTSDNKDLKSFRQQVSLAALTEMREAKKELILRKVPVRLTLTFFFSRPLSKSKKAHMTVLPDLDKLIRSVGDALSGICYADDSQVIEVNASKAYEQPERVIVQVESLDSNTKEASQCEQR